MKLPRCLSSELAQKQEFTVCGYLLDWLCPRPLFFVFATADIISGDCNDDHDYENYDDDDDHHHHHHGNDNDQSDNYHHQDNCHNDDCDVD